MVTRWPRSSQYSGVISSADSSRTPRRIVSIMLALTSLMVSLSLRLFDDTHGLALGARDRARPHHRHVDPEAERRAEAGRNVLAHRRKGGMIGLQPRGALDQGGSRLHLDLQPRQRRAAIDDQLVLRQQVVDTEERRLDLGGIHVDP